MLADGSVSDLRDKTTIGLTKRARDIAERIKEREAFSELRDVAVVGFGVAVNAGLSIGVARDVGTIWNIGTFDPSGHLRDVVLALFEDLDQPYKQIEYLVNSGLEILAVEYEGAETSSSLIAVLNRLS